MMCQKTNEEYLIHSDQPFTEFSYSNHVDNPFQSPTMNVLIGCEESQVVCKAFRELGHNAYSCDLQECSGGHPEWHLQMDVFTAIQMKKWDMGIFFPPCTYLTSAGNRHFPNNPARWQKRVDAMMFVYNLYNCEIERVGIENPIGVIASYMRKPDQIIHPYYFGDNVPKRTGLWLRNLPKLTYSMKDNLFENKTAVDPHYLEYNSKRTKSGKSRYSVLGKLGKNHGKERSVTFPGIARAMAEQWGSLKN